MRQKTHGTVSFTKRSVSLLLALLIVLASIAFCVSTTVAAATVTYYFDTSENTAWNPGSGEKLVATFTNSSGAKVGTTANLASAGTNLYSVTAPDGAADVQLYLVRSGYTMPDTVPAKGNTRVFFKNNINWNPPRVYCWTDGGEMDFDNSPSMTKVSSSSNLWWYYDTPYKNVIFNNGSAGDANQTADLAITGKNLVYSKYAKSSGSSGWDSAPYYKKYAEVSLSSRPSGANEMYAMSGDTVQFSKYAYKSSDPRNFNNGKTIYLYNPDWTDASKVKVTWDLDDPYNYSATMTAVSGMETGFYQAVVPSDAKIQFSYNNAKSAQTVIPTTFSEPCFNMKNGTSRWCELADAAGGEPTDYSAPVESSGHNSSSAFWVDAVYYDYLSDAEYTSGWLNPIQAGTAERSTGKGYNGSQDNWYAFYNFNNKISQYADSNPSWQYPLYFGNFCNTYDAYYYQQHNGPYYNAIKDLTRYDYYYNNSNGLKDYSGKDGYHTSVKGLVGSSLNNSGNISYSSNNGTSLPFFDSDFLSSTNTGKSVKSSFPFRTEDLGNGITMYSFDSNAGKDNVFFNWNDKTPTSVGYGQGSAYAVDDGLKYFMNTPSGKGIFPFNNTSDTKGSKNSNENINYGFGIKMNMDFRVPDGGKLPKTTVTVPSNEIWINSDHGTVACHAWGSSSPTSSPVALSKNSYGYYVMPSNLAGCGNFLLTSQAGNWDANKTADQTTGGRLGTIINYNGSSVSNTGTRSFDVDKNVTFDFSGDDDLWVYITPYKDNGELDYANSQLVLDLGGNHKMATGKIDFATMTATADWTVDATTDVNFKGDTMYIVDENGWGNVAVHTWGGPGGDFWITPKTVTINGKKYYTVDEDDFKGNTKFQCTKGIGDYSAQSGDTDLKGQFGNIVKASAPGDIFVQNTNGGSVYLQNLTPYSSTTSWGFESNGSGGYKNLDPNKTYHMSVFYMERGMLESNCKIEFTMTPAQNDVKVSKTINTTDVNPGIAEGMDADSFDFYNKENGTVDKSAHYSLNGSSLKAVNSSNGIYSVNNMGIADFDNQYKTGSTITVSEKKPTGGIKYNKTEWEVINNANGEKIDSGTDTGHPTTDTTTRGFVLENANKSSYVTRQVNFVNTPAVSDLSIDKHIVDENGGELTTPVEGEFSFEILVNLHPEVSGSTYKPYKLGYEVTSGGDTTELTTDENGRFKFSSNDTVKIKGLPVGAKYKITELTASGYKPYKITVNGSEADFDGIYNGTVLDDDSTVTVTNKQQPVEAALQTVKYLSQSRESDAVYSEGDLFTFVAQGLPATEYNIEGISGTSESAVNFTTEGTYSDANGIVTYGGMNFTKKGYYIFTITEKDEINNVPEDTFYEDDFSYDTTKFLAAIKVVDGTGGSLEVEHTKYFYWDGNPVTAASFNNPIESEYPEFKNSVTPGKITIFKTDGANAPLNDVKFDLYKVNNSVSKGVTTRALDDDELDTVLEDKTLVETQTTDTYEIDGSPKNGVAIFENIDIFKKNANGKYDADPEYQAYALVEKSTVDGHIKSKVVKIFTLPIADDSGDPKYEITFDYVNGVIKSPDTAGIGTIIFRVVGITAVALSIIMLLAYVLYFRKKGFSFTYKKKH